MIEPMYVELLAERLGLSKSTVCFHLKKLEDAKIVSSCKEQYYSVYSLNEDIFHLTLGDLVQEGCRGDHLRPRGKTNIEIRLLQPVSRASCNACLSRK